MAYLQFIAGAIFLKTACNHTFFKVLVRLERQSKNRANNAVHFIVNAIEICIFQRNIVLVDENYGLPAFWFIRFS